MVATMQLLDKMASSLEGRFKDEYEISIIKANTYGSCADGFNISIDPGVRLSEEVREILNFGILTEHKLLNKKWETEEDFITSFNNLINKKIEWYEKKIEAKD
jgi:hypothetical protein